MNRYKVIFDMIATSGWQANQNQCSITKIKLWKTFSEIEVCMTIDFETSTYSLTPDVSLKGAENSLAVSGFARQE